MSENQSDSLALKVAAFSALEAALKAELELAGGAFLSVKGKMVLASLGALRSEIDELIVLARRPTVIPQEAVQDGLLQRRYILQFDKDELGLRISALNQAAEDLFTALTQAVFQHREPLQDESNFEIDLLPPDMVRVIATTSRTLSIHRELAPALQSQIRGLSNAIRVLRLETLATSLAIVEPSPDAS